MAHAATPILFPDIIFSAPLQRPTRRALAAHRFPRRGVPVATL
jgi:hypothetical protein